MLYTYLGYLCYVGNEGNHFYKTHQPTVSRTLYSRKQSPLLASLAVPRLLFVICDCSCSCLCNTSTVL